jgi:RNA-directed DNA polymerase
MTMPTELCRIQVSELQQRLARRATNDPAHRFTNLYDLLTWPTLLAWAFDKLMTNSGSRTAGIDGLDKRTAIKHRDTILADLRSALKHGTYHHQPVRRVFIPKANGKRRPLGIPTFVDRLVQLMVKAILEPIFESDFFPESHGFRPQRSCHTALAHLHFQAGQPQKKLYWAIEGDISGCFDHIQHRILVRLLKRRIQDQRLIGVIWQMLRAGVMEGSLFSTTAEGTPQGGVVSPLLANIYLHELDRWMHQHYLGLNYLEKAKRRAQHLGNAAYVRYADDFVVAWNGPKAGAEQLKAELATFLRDQMGLTLSEEKTRITHITEGYDFLGHTVKQARRVKGGKRALLIYPSKTSVMKLKAKIKGMTKRQRSRDGISHKIDALNSVLRGWAHYFRHQCASRTFAYIGSFAFRRMQIWLRHKTGQKVSIIYQRYYHRHQRYLTWVHGNAALISPGAEVAIERQRYKARPNPYLTSPATVALAQHLTPDYRPRDWEGACYYGEDWPEIRQHILERDEQRCRFCGKTERLEVHHIRRYKQGQPHEPKNLITLCKGCHQQMQNRRSEASRWLARLHSAAGEPEASKDARPVRGGA